MSTPPHSLLQDLRFDGDMVVVTGAGRGIGRACAMAFAECGARVVLVSRTQADLEEVSSQIEEHGGSAVIAVCDVTDAASVADLFRRIDSIDVLVNSAGSNIPEPFLDVTEEHLEHLLATNVRATFFTCQQAVRRMLENSNGGVIVNISSQMGHVGAANRTVYCAAKHAIEGLTKALAVELAPSGIRVNAVAPTFIETPLTQPFLANPHFRQEVLASIPLGRIGTADDVVGAVLFAASSAASLMTGSSIVVDGGWTAR